MRSDQNNEDGWAEIRALQDDDELGPYVRLLLNACVRDNQPGMRAQARRLLIDWPLDMQASRVLLRRLRDVGS
jgi:hypothetical protein